MITPSMQLATSKDADVWAENMGLQTAQQERNVSNYIWNHKPAVGCTYEEWKEANPAFEDEKTFWSIADGKYAPASKPAPKPARKRTPQPGM